MIPEGNIFIGKASAVSVNRVGGSMGCSESLSGDFREQSPLRKILGFKGHIDWLKIDLNTAKIIVVQNYKPTKN